MRTFPGRGPAASDSREARTTTAPCDARPLRSLRSLGWAVAIAICVALAGCTGQHHEVRSDQSASPMSGRSSPVLGVPWGFWQQGYGQPHPVTILNGGDGEIDNIHWISWGGGKAIGNGMARWDVSALHDQDARLVAFNLGYCHGELAYTAIEWYFPQHGQLFDSNSYVNICTWRYVSEGNAHAIGGPASAAAIARAAGASVVDINVAYTASVDGAHVNVKYEAMGLVISSSGRVLAESLYPSNASNINVIVSVPSLGRIYPALIIGSDSREDITILQLQDAAGLHPIDTSASFEIKPGERCVALMLGLGMPSAPGGWLDFSPTRITALDQAVRPDSFAPSLARIIQTADPTSEDSNGAPLVDMSGHVIGMELAASALYPTPGYPGFAIPIGVAMSTAERIEAAWAAKGSS